METAIQEPRSGHLSRPDSAKALHDLWISMDGNEHEAELAHVLGETNSYGTIRRPELEAQDGRIFSWNLTGFQLDIAASEVRGVCPGASCQKSFNSLLM